ncbi:hypothetical protein DFJ73DRAFT_831331, partial [Zopfochytrium polystomum]
MTKRVKLAGQSILAWSWLDFHEGWIDPFVELLFASADFAGSATKHSKLFERAIDIFGTTLAAYYYQIKSFETDIVLQMKAKTLQAGLGTLTQQYDHAVLEFQSELTALKQNEAKLQDWLNQAKVKIDSISMENNSLKEHKVRSEVELRNLREDHGELLSKIATMSGQMRSLDTHSVGVSFDLCRHLADSFLSLSEFRAIEYWEQLWSSVFELGYQSVIARRKQIARLMGAPDASHSNEGSEVHDRSEKLITGFLQASSAEQVRQLLFHLIKRLRLEKNAYSESLGYSGCSDGVAASITLEPALTQIDKNVKETLEVLMGTTGRRGKTPRYGWDGSLLEAIGSLLAVSVESALVEPPLSFSFCPDYFSQVDTIESGKVSKGRCVVIMPGLIGGTEVKRKLVAVYGTKEIFDGELVEKVGGYGFSFSAMVASVASVFFRGKM